VTYRNFADNALSYATESSSWSVETVDTCRGGTSIKIGQDGSPRIAYNSFVPNTVTSSVKYAQKNGSEWLTQTIDTGRLYNSYDVSMALSSEGDAHIVYSLNRILKYAVWSDNSWDIQTIDVTGNVIAPSLVLGDGDIPHLSFYNDTTNEVMYAQFAGGFWNVESVFTNARYSETATSIAFDSYGNVHIANSGNSGLIYAVAAAPEPAIPPDANANGPYSIYVGDTLTLDGSGSTDADNDIVSYMWDLDDDGSFETDAGSQAIFDVNYSHLESLELLINHTYIIGLKVTDSQGQSDVADSTLIIVPKPALAVAVDIKPGGCPNPVNVKSSGVLPVAILGTGDYDVTTIDPTSIAFSFGEISVGAIRSGYEDVAGPVSDVNDCNCTEEGPDGFLDLTLKFKTQRIVEAIGDVNDGDVWVLTLTGVLLTQCPLRRLLREPIVS